MNRHLTYRRGVCIALFGLLAWTSSQAEAGGLFRRRSRTPVPTTRVQPTSAAPLGTFTPTPYMTVRGNFPTGGGYSPNDSFGDTSMDLYGPLSALRSTSAPVTTYSRGYDGRLTASEGTSFSTPNLPENSPVVYPTQGSYYYGFRQATPPPGWPKAINWIDQD
ncbi:hypothetical protein [Singulisphaera sp. PoT]|uniref:hypothetical protein n=1 Tax=Singulisphaera sp. PoT TaxID=3411797 RepID=UPI003BF4611E